MRFEGRSEKGDAVSRATGGGPDAEGRFGAFGGRYVPETLMQPLRDLEEAYLGLREDPAFNQELQGYLTR